MEQANVNSSREYEDNDLENNEVWACDTHWHATISNPWKDSDLILVYINPYKIILEFPPA